MDFLKMTKDTPAFANSYYSGMSIQVYLIGKCLEGLGREWTLRTPAPQEIADSVIAVVDEIIAQIEFKDSRK